MILCLVGWVKYAVGLLQGWQRRHCPKGKGKVVTLTSAKGLPCPLEQGQIQGLDLDDDSKQKPWNDWDHICLGTDYLGWFGEPPLKLSEGDKHQ